MPTPAPSSAGPPRRSGRWQFGLATLLLAMTSVCVASAFFSGILGKHGDHEVHLGFVLAAVAAPIALMMGLGILLTVLASWRRWRGNRVDPDDDS